MIRRPTNILSPEWKVCALSALCALSLVASVTGRAESPFAVTASGAVQEGQSLVRIHIDVPPGYMLYAEHLHISRPGNLPLTPVELSQPIRKMDEFSGEEKDVFESPVSAVFKADGEVAGPIQIKIEFQGCSETLCFFPETHVLDVSFAAPANSAAPVESGPATALAVPSGDLNGALKSFRVAAQASGYLGVRDFLAFLDQAEGKARPAESWARLFQDDPVAFYRKTGVAMTLALIVLGGLLLNLTPCVLPMIPINLAIIGAGAHASSRKRGFALGGVYGLAIALVYGLLGLVVVLTQSRFGTLNSSPWFSLAVAAVFLVMALAMFDLLHIDFARFQGGVKTASRSPRGSYVLALTMGAISALLAGACVAPVVISVLVLAGSLYSNGIYASLLFPFVLGLGMALPWPLAGAGLSVLPKPGRWMIAVKYAFGAFILLMSLYYGSLAYRGFRGNPPIAAPPDSAGNVRRVSADQSGGELAQALDEAQALDRFVLLDFWATWCKNCEVMEATTFRHAAVASRLAAYQIVKVQTERPNDPPAREVLDLLQIRGLPTYVILAPLPSP